MTFKSKFLGRHNSKQNDQVEASPMEMFFNNASSTFSSVVGEAQSMAEDIHSIATSDVDSVTGAQEEDEIVGAVDRFFNNVSSVFSGAVEEAQSMAEDIHSIATSDVDSVIEAQEEEEEEVSGDHFTLAQQVRKLGKLEQLVDKAEKQIMKYERQIEKAEEEQVKAREIIKTHYAGVLSVVEKEPNEELSPWQRFFNDPSDTFEKAMGVANDDDGNADLDHKESRRSNKKKLNGSHSALAKQIKKLSKLEELVEKAEKQIMKYENEIEMAEDEQEKTQEMINFLSKKLSIGNHAYLQNGKDGVESLSSVVGDDAARLAYQAVFPHDQLEL